jgi:hypothetical protein
MLSGSLATMKEGEPMGVLFCGTNPPWPSSAKLLLPKYRAYQPGESSVDGTAATISVDVCGTVKVAEAMTSSSPGLGKSSARSAARAGRRAGRTA